jgi:hypothetical protein
MHVVTNHRVYSVNLGVTVPFRSVLAFGTVILSSRMQLPTAYLPRWR